MRCLEVRETSDGFRRRRYVTDAGVRVSTIEVPLEVWHSINKQGRASDRATEWRRARARDEVKAKALELIRSHWKVVAVAHELKVPVRTIQRWRAAAKGMIDDQ